MKNQILTTIAKKYSVSLANIVMLADTIVEDVKELVTSIADPTRSQQKIIQGIYKNPYHLKIKDAAKFLHDDGLVPGYREIPFHDEDEMMVEVRVYMKERIAVHERSARLKVIENAKDEDSSSEDEISARPGGRKARRSGIQLDKTPTKNAKTTPKTPKSQNGIFKKEENVQGDLDSVEYEVGRMHHAWVVCRSPHQELDPS
jgi:hypothetical protein